MLALASHRSAMAIVMMQAASGKAAADDPVRRPHRPGAGVTVNE